MAVRRLICDQFYKYLSLVKKWEKNIGKCIKEVEIGKKYLPSKMLSTAAALSRKIRICFCLTFTVRDLFSAPISFSYEIRKEKLRKEWRTCFLF